MNQDVQKLEELLARVRRNAAVPRTRVSAGTREASAPVHEPPAIPYKAPPYVPPAAEFTAEEVFFESEPPPKPAPVPVYVPEFAPDPVVQPSARLEAEVDELLLEDPFPSSPPAAAAPPYTEVLEDPIPLVSVSSPRRADLDEDVSGVMSIPEFGDEQPEELLEDDIVEMSPAEAEQPAVTHALDELSFDDVDVDDKRAAQPSEEEPPASSSRSKIAATMDEALARAAEQIQLEEGREVPLKTPPPESGPQAAAPPVAMHAPLAPDIEELLEADILPAGGVRAAVPTAEQLGQTIDLDEARGPSLELDQPTAAFGASPLQDASEELEVTLPGREFGGRYQDDLMPPPEARQELDAHRKRVEDDAVPPAPESLAQPPTSGFSPVLAPASVTTDSHSQSVSTVTIDAPAKAEFAPELLARPELGPSPVAKFIRSEAPRPKTFMELLDSSLALGSD